MKLTMMKIDDCGTINILLLSLDDSADVKTLFDNAVEKAETEGFQGKMSDIPDRYLTEQGLTS